MAPHLYPDPPFSALSAGQSTPRQLRLDDDVTMLVFTYYRLGLVDGINWNQERWWYKLTHVCRRWRRLILSYPSHLDLHIVCTYGTPVIDMLAHSPPFQLIINYPNQNAGITAEDEEGLLFALQDRERISRISLTASNTNCNRVLAAMDGEFPELRQLRITFGIKNDLTSILPATFRASRLSSPILTGSSHPTGAPLTTVTAIHLADLTIRGLLPSTDFHPEYLVTQLSSMPLLTTVSLGFRLPIPNRDLKKQILNLRKTHITLSHLTKFMFRGVSSFLEGLLDRISTPLLEKFGINFFNQLTFSLPHLSQFICTTPRLKLPIARVNFKKDHISIIVDDNALHQHPSPAFLRINVDCQHHGWQVDAAAQICNAMAPVLSVVHELTLRFRKHGISSNNEDEVDFTKWHDLLRPFTRLEILRVLHPMLARELFCALQSHDGECHQDVLPQLRELALPPHWADGEAFVAFLSTYRATDCLTA